MRPVYIEKREKERDEREMALLFKANDPALRERLMEMGYLGDPRTELHRERWSA